MNAGSRRIVIVGGGGHAKVVISLLKKTAWEIAGYTDPRDRGAILGVPYLGDDASLPELLENYPGCRAVLGVGKMDCSPGRLAIQEKIELLGFEFPVIVSPQAVVNEEVELGRGTVLCDGAVVTSGVVTGKACILNTNSTVEHDCRIADNVHIASGATVCGGVAIGRDCFIGAGATIIQGVVIAAGSCVGAGAVVVRSLEVPGHYVGNPASRIRAGHRGERA